MIVWFYRSKLLEAAQAAAERHPSLTLRLEHYTLVLFRREYRNENEPSVLLFDSYDELKKIVKEIMGESGDYSDVAVDTFGDTWTKGELKEMFDRSTYALKECGGMMSDVYRTNGKMVEAVASILETNVEDHKNRVTMYLSEELGITFELAVRLVKFGIVSGPAMAGLTTNDLTIGGEFSMDEANEIIDKGTKKGHV